MQITRAPFARAPADERPEMRVRRERVRAPEQDRASLSGLPRGSVADRSRRTSCASPSAPAIEQIVRSSSDAPRRWKKRGPSTRPAPGPSCRRSSTAGSPAARRREATIAFRRSAISSSASSQVIALEPSLPFRARRGSADTAAGPGDTCARGTAITFVQRNPLRQRMVGIAGDADGAAVLDGDEHRAGVGAIVGAGGADDSGMSVGSLPCAKAGRHPRDVETRDLRVVRARNSCDDACDS